MDQMDPSPIVKCRSFLSLIWRVCFREPIRALRKSLRPPPPPLASPPPPWAPPPSPVWDADRGVPIRVDDATRLARVADQGSLPPPMSETEVCAAGRIAVRLHPLSVNSSKWESRFYCEQTVEAPGMTLEHLVGRYWFPESGFLISETGQVWRHTTAGRHNDWNFLSTGVVEAREKPDGSPDPVFHAELLHDAPWISDEMLLISHFPSTNYGHYLIDMVPLIAEGVKRRAPMLSRPLHRWHRDLIIRLGGDPAKVVEVAHHAVFLDHVIVSNRQNCVSTYRPNPADKAAYHAIRAAVARVGHSALNLRKVFVCRGSGHGRNIENRAALAEALSSRGFVAVQPEKLSLDDQVMLFAGADVIVAEFGAAMANVVFCRPGVKIVEIIPEGQFDTWSANLCAAYELEHVVLFQPNNREPRDPVDNDFSYVVDIAAVTGILSALSI
jgi:hypothetical protein